MSGVVIIPALNEERSITTIISKIVGYSDVIVVDDGSTDSTAVVAQKAGAEVLSLTENVGYDGALSKGFEYAQERGYDFFLTFDADGQLPTKKLWTAYMILSNEEAELVIGVRDNVGRWSEQIFNFLVKSRFQVNDILCGLKGYSRRLYEEYGDFTYSKSVGTELALYGLKKRYPHKTVQIRVADRPGRSRFGGAITGHMKILNAMFRWQRNQST